jgi:hypothetical protein
MEEAEVEAARFFFEWWLLKLKNNTYLMNHGPYSFIRASLSKPLKGLRRVKFFQNRI